MVVFSDLNAADEEDVKRVAGRLRGDMDDIEKDLDDLLNEGIKTGASSTLKIYGVQNVHVDFMRCS
mgnify:CR=1 FL=1